MIKVVGIIKANKSQPSVKWRIGNTATLNKVAERCRHEMVATPMFGSIQEARNWLIGKMGHSNDIWDEPTITLSHKIAERR
jgi:hypothetical protein